MVEDLISRFREASEAKIIPILQKSGKVNGAMKAAAFLLLFSRHTDSRDLINSGVGFTIHIKGSSVIIAPIPRKEKDVS